MSNEIDQGCLRGIRERREHQLAEELAAEGKAVDAGGERSVLLGLDGVAVTLLVEGEIGRLHLCRDSGTVLARPGPLAGGDNLPEVLPLSQRVEVI